LDTINEMKNSVKKINSGRINLRLLITFEGINVKN